jgi:hypothetical protein
MTRANRLLSFTCIDALGSTEGDSAGTSPELVHADAADIL